MPNSLSRKKDPRKSLLRNLATSLILYEKIKTTLPKAREVKPIVEHLLSVAVSSDPKQVTLRRRLNSYFFDENASRKVIEVLVPRYKDMQSGYIKIVKADNRLGDSAQMAYVILAEGKKEVILKEFGDNKDVAKK